jgi:hypothetical protein
VADYQQLLGDRFGLDPARERTQALSQDAAKLHDALERLRVRLAAGDTAPANLAAINAALMALGRAIIPLNYTAAGPFGHDPALSVPPLPLLDAARQLAVAPAGSDAAKFSAVALQRGLNQVVHGLDAALAAVAMARAVVGE